MKTQSIRGLINEENEVENEMKGIRKGIEQDKIIVIE